jgi:hypothetical protein
LHKLGLSYCFIDPVYPEYPPMIKRSIEMFRSVSPDCLPEARVLYNGEQIYQVNQTRVFNMFQSEQGVDFLA